MSRNEDSQYSFKSNFKIGLGLLVGIQEPVQKQNLDFRSSLWFVKFVTRIRKIFKNIQNIATKYQNYNKKYKIVFEITNRKIVKLLNAKL